MHRRPTITYRLPGPGNPEIHAESILDLCRFLARHRIAVTGGEEAHVMFRLDPHRPFTEDLPAETIELITTLEPAAAFKPGRHFGSGVSPVAHTVTNTWNHTPRPESQP